MEQGTIPVKNKKSGLDFIDIVLLSTVFLVLLSISIYLIRDMQGQNRTYEKIITHLLSVSTIKQPMSHTEGGKTVVDTILYVGDENNAAILAFSRAKDFANMKLASTLLGFLLVFVGALYLLKVFNLSYNASYESDAVGKVSLQTTSPGLVMITLGVAVIFVALLAKNVIDYTVPSSQTPVSNPISENKTDTTKSNKAKNPEAIQHETGNNTGIAIVGAGNSSITGINIGSGTLTGSTGPTVHTEYVIRNNIPGLKPYLIPQKGTMIKLVDTTGKSKKHK